MRITFRRRNKFWTYLTLSTFLFGCYFVYKNWSDFTSWKTADDVLSIRKRRFLEYQKNEGSRSGPGEYGEPVRLEGEEKKRADALMPKEAFNIVASDKIALDRAVRDVRDPKCKAITYPKVLPKASVVIIFHNEAWSPLLRTVHSVVNRSPPEYLEEVILLDDFSDRPELGSKLEKYVAETWPDGVVKIVRTEKRCGLIRARIEGAKPATGDVLIFLDSHCEAGPGWIEPLLSRIAEDRHNVLCPEIDLLDKETLQYGGTGSFSVGGFWWSLHFSWRPIPQREKERRKSSIDPIRIEPMLYRIYQDRRNVLCPIITNILDTTLEYSAHQGYHVGGFTWSLHFTWRNVPAADKISRKDTDPVKIEPLLWRIQQDRRHVLCPIVDDISDKTLEFSRNGGYSVGGFTWSLHFTWRNVPKEDVESRKYTDPVRSPTMAGGLFAINREYFWEIGSYDPGMDVWGGENLEISFRAWMCGGRLEFIPCSRVGHIFRSSHPYTFPGNKDTHGINSMRLAEVWMDEYKRLFYTHRKDLLGKYPGDVTERRALREKLHCKSFKWYLDNVYPEKFIPDENVHAWGMMRNPSSNICLDTLQRDEKATFEMGLFHCQNGVSANQVFSYSIENEIRREEGCLTTQGENNSVVKLEPCDRQKVTQKWKHDKETGAVVHESTGKCLDKSDIKSGKSVIVKDCKKGEDSQRWVFEHYLD